MIVLLFQPFELPPLQSLPGGTLAALVKTVINYYNSWKNFLFVTAIISKPDIRKVPIVHFYQHLDCQRIDVVLSDFCQISLVNLNLFPSLPPSLQLARNLQFKKTQKIFENDWA